MEANALERDLQLSNKEDWRGRERLRESYSNETGGAEVKVGREDGGGGGQN